MTQPQHRTKARTMCSEYPRVTLNLLRLLRLLLTQRPEPFYGLELMTQLQLSSGTVYGMLHKLQQAGLVVTELEDIDERAAGRRKRRWWTLTPAGREFVRRELQAVQELVAP